MSLLGMAYAYILIFGLVLSVLFIISDNLVFNYEAWYLSNITRLGEITLGGRLSIWNCEITRQWSVPINPGYVGFLRTQDSHGDIICIFK